MSLCLLAPLVFAALAAAPTPTVSQEQDPAAIHPLAGAAGVSQLCDALADPERRSGGDAVDRGEAAARRAEAREDALAARYQLDLPAARLAFAPYDAPERRLALAEAAPLPVAPRVAVWLATERGLAVQLDATAARSVLAAQRAGRLGLTLVFDLAEEATCSSGRPGAALLLPVEPVEWAWTDGDRVLARGGAAADRPAVDLAGGARPRVDVGEPIAGPGEAKKAVLARRADLEACYAETLKKDPAVDGVVVVELSPTARLAIAADSTGAPELSACVGRALATLATPAGGKAAVPIRFDLVVPEPAPAGPAPR